MRFIKKEASTERTRPAIANGSHLLKHNVLPYGNVTLHANEVFLSTANVALVLCVATVWHTLLLCQLVMDLHFFTQWSRVVTNVALVPFVKQSTPQHARIVVTKSLQGFGCENVSV